jgi:diaminohydroxyphosphoribosylaminopyrimidine deaminase / 5-amino-6-(5-phosphoribosylamino)uracil reductase
MPEPHDTLHLNTAHGLAISGIGRASPNPTVGCVVVKNEKIVGKGFHQYDALDHAEIVALKEAGDQARGATLYVNLEPCSHTGRTGPCADAIIEAGVHRVVAGMEDPNPKVAGRGFRKLRDAGIQVDLPLREEQEFARRLNEAFACWVRTKRPFVTLKSALTLDGQLAPPRSNRKANSFWFTSEESRYRVHFMRHKNDALLTGIGTILADNPLLTDRSGYPRRRKLLRVVLDSRLRLPVKSRIVRSCDDDLLVFTAASLKSPKARLLQKAGAELVRLPARRGRIDLISVLNELGHREILSVLLETGPELNTSAIAANIVHKIFLFYARIIAGENTVPFAHSAFTLSSLSNIQFHQFGPDFAVEAYLRDVYA